MKAVQLLVNSLLPPDLRDPAIGLDAGSIEKKLVEVAQKYPDKFERISKDISDVGRNAAFEEGSSIRLSDLRAPFDVGKIYGEMDREIAALKKLKLDPQELKREKLRIWQSYSDRIEKTMMEEGGKSGNALVNAVASGARGKPAQIRSMLAGAGLFTDARGEPIPYYVRRSYGQGVRPADMLAGSYGARTSVISTKTCLRRGTLVRMADGSTRAIESLVPGDMVLGADAEGRTFPVAVARLYDQGIQEVYEWRFRPSTRRKQSIVMHATARHKILGTSLRTYNNLSSARKRGKQVDPGPAYHEKKILPVGAGEHRQAAVLPTAEANLPGGVEEPYALILGLLAGDGCLSAKTQRGAVRLFVSCADPTLPNDLKRHLSALGLKWRSSSGHNHTCEITLQNFDRSAQCRARINKGRQGFSPGPARPDKVALVESGMHGKLAHEKELPVQFYTWSSTSQNAYLAGLFAADASFGVQGGSAAMAFYLTSKRLVEQVADVLLWRFGIVAAHFIRTEEYQTVEGRRVKRVNPLWGFNVSAHHEMVKLQSVFAMMPGKKGRDAAELLCGKVLRQDNPYTKAYVTRGELLGNLPCFDIEVDHPDHLFVLANGLIVSNSTAKGGDWSKLAAQATADQVVTEKDCGTQNGIDMSLGEANLQGRVLARGVKGLDSGTILDKQGLGLLWRAKPEKVIVRSPLTCQAGAGVCAKCVGLRKGGKLPEIGDSIGITAATALGEPITQSALNTKHTAGQASGKREYSGFNWISQFTQAPDDYPDKASLSTEDGSVEEIRDAPQGGKYIRVNGKDHFVLPGFAESVKVGDVVERGDQLSEGLVNPSEMVDLRGLGEGRRFYADRLKKMLDDSGMKADPVNVELVTRGLLRHVRMDDPDEWSEYLPDDIVDYEKFRQSYSPPEDTHPNDPESAIGLYLQQPTLHYTIGTRITPKVAARMKGAGFNKVQVSQAEPWFKAEMPRMRTASHVNDDWLASMHTSYLKGQLGSSAVRGADTSIGSNVHFAPRLAQGAGFGEHARTTGKF